MMIDHRFLCLIFGFRWQFIGGRTITIPSVSHSTDIHSSTRISRLRLVAAVSTLALALMLSLPSIGSAGSPSPEREDAANAVYTAVTSVYKSATVRAGRRVETDCSGSGFTYSCNWWVIKNRFDRVGSKAAEQSPPMSRKGEGEQHKKPAKVKYSGSATATWACTKRSKKNVCTAGGFSVSLK